jgi:hypothetical protein
MTRELEERYILEWAEITGTTIYTLLTEYFIDGRWQVVHTESYFGYKPQLDDCEIIESDYVSFLKRVTYKPKTRTKEGIWYKNNERKTMPLAHFTNIITTGPVSEPVWENLAEAHFYSNDMGEIIDNSELTECLNRVEEDVMYFNFNWIPEKNYPTPLKLILSLMDKRIDVEILFHDKEGKGIYKVKLENFKFKKIYNLRNYNWGDNNIKELAVEYTFETENIVVPNDNDNEKFQSSYITVNGLTIKNNIETNE